MEVGLTEVFIFGRLPVPVRNHIEDLAAGRIRQSLKDPVAGRFFIFNH